MFMSKEELHELTGYRNRPGQIRWLSQRGYKFELDRSGRPRVLRAAIVAALGGNEQQPKQLRRVEPHWDRI
jgi:hypothetical protein